MRNIIVVLLVIVGVYLYATFERVEAYTNSYQAIIVSGDCLIHGDIITIEVPVPQFKDFTSEAREVLQNQYLVDACEARGGVV